MKEKANIYVFAAPSGGGKTSLVKALLKRMKNIEVSISHTTRPKRAAEQEGRDYFFVNPEQFEQLKAADCFIECATVFGAQYGTSKQQIKQRLMNGIDVLLDIDWQGARQLKSHFDNVVTIFILPPSVEILSKRLLDRQQDDSSTINYRMQKAQDEIKHYNEFDYLIVNDDFEQALEDIESIIKSERLKTTIQKMKYQSLLSNLLMSK